MSNEITPELIRGLIDAVKSTNDTVKELTMGVTELVQAERVRVEKDLHQEKKNEKVEEFVDRYRPTLDRIVVWHATVDRVKVPLIFALIVAIGTLLGVNWKA